MQRGWTSEDLAPRTQLPDRGRAEESKAPARPRAPIPRAGAVHSAGTAAGRPAGSLRASCPVAVALLRVGARILATGRWGHAGLGAAAGIHAWGCHVGGLRVRAGHTDAAVGGQRT